MEHKNFTNLRFMFQHLDNLTSFPDISKWNTKNVNIWLLLSPIV